MATTLDHDSIVVPKPVMTSLTAVESAAQAEDAFSAAEGWSTQRLFWNVRIPAPKPLGSRFRGALNSREAGHDGAKVDAARSHTALHSIKANS